MVAFGIFLELVYYCICILKTDNKFNNSPIPANRNKILAVNWELNSGHNLWKQYKKFKGLESYDRIRIF